MLDYYVVNAFTDQPFTGNPAGVVLLENELEEVNMQAIAKENGLSETAFILKTDDCYHIWWFTPKKEVDLCGHATLASAFVISKFVDKTCRDITFFSKSGFLTVSIQDDLYTLNFPLQEVVPVPIEQDWEQELVLSIQSAYKTPDEEHLILFLDHQQALIDFQVNEDKIIPLARHGVTLTAPADDEAIDYLLRYFAPNYGIPEDPVTGSAQTRLAPIWSKRLKRTHLVARQMSERQGFLILELDGEHINITGQARLYSKGKIFL